MKSFCLYLIGLAALCGAMFTHSLQLEAAKKPATPDVPADAPKNTPKAETVKNAPPAFQVDDAELAKLWFDALKLLDNKDPQKLGEALLKLKEVDLKKVETGQENLADYAAVLLKYVNTLKQQSRRAEAGKLLALAKQLAPDFADVYFASAQLRLAESFTDIFGAAQDVGQGLLLTVTDLHALLIYANNGLAFVLLGCAITATVFILFAFAYYWRAIFFYCKTLVPLPLPTFAINLLGWLGVGVITLTLGIFWGIFGLAVLLLPHVDPAPKRILQTTLLFGSLVPVLLIVVSITFIATDQDYFAALRDVAYRDYSQRTVNALQQRLQTYPDDDYARFGLAYMMKNTGNLPDALTLYGKISGQYPDQAAVQNNLGNIYQIQFRQSAKKGQKDPGLQQKAEEAYTSAIGFAPKMFEPRYNVGQLLIYANVGQSDDSSLQLNAARQLDGARFSRYSEYLQYNLITVDASFATWTLLQKLAAPEFLDSGLALARNFWRSGSRFDNPWYFSAAAFVLFGFSLAASAKKGAPQKVRYCEMCGDPYAAPRKKSEEPTTFCTQCTYIFKKKTTVKVEKRAEKVQQIQLRQKMRGLLAKLSSACIPGAGQIYLGYVVKGVLIALVFDVALVIALLKFQTGMLLGSPDLSLLALSLNLLVLAGTYAFNMYDIYQLSPRNQ